MAIGRIPEPGTGIPESIVDAKGDIVTATAADTPARLAVGTNDHRLVAASGEATGLKYVADTQNTVVDAKGDLLVGTAADTIARLAVGTNGYTLVADSSTSTGLKWAAASSPSYPWSSFTPTVTSQGGTPTTVSAEARYAQIDKIVIYQFKVDITNAGTATGHITIDLPVTHESGSQSSGYCVEYNNTGESGSVIQTSSAPYIRNYSFSTWWANGNKILGTLIYKAA